MRASNKMFSTEDISFISYFLNAVLQSTQTLLQCQQIKVKRGNLKCTVSPAPYSLT